MSLQYLNLERLEFLSGGDGFGWGSVGQEHYGGSGNGSAGGSGATIAGTGGLQGCSWGCTGPDGWGPVSRYYDLTQCFINGGLFTAVNVLFIAAALHAIYALARDNRDRKYRKSLVLYARMALIGVQMLFTVVYAAAVWNSSDGAHSLLQDVMFVQPLLQAAALAASAFLHYFDYFYSDISLGVLLFYWLALALLYALRALNFAIRSQFGHLFTLTLFQSINAVFVLLSEYTLTKPFLHFDATTHSLSPFDKADVFSKLTFSWMTPLMKAGYEKYLTEDDLPNLPRTFKSKYISQYFLDKWNASTASRSLGWTLVRTFGPPLITGGACKFVQDILQFTQPQLLRLLIKFVNTYNSDSPEPLVKGFMVVLGMFTLSVVQTIFLHQYFLRAFNVGMNIKSSLTATVYQKSLLLSNEAKGNKATGDIVNLMSVDTQRLQDLTQNVSIIWSGPFQIILCLTSLYQLLGHSMWIGVFIMIIMIPLNAVIVRKMKALQKTQMKFKDERTRIISEILNNIKSLKLYGWENPYKEKLMDVRNNKELNNLRKTGIFQAIGSFQFNIAPFLVSCSTFGVFVLTQDKPLSADLVFPALSLFNLLSFPLAVIPMAITSLVESQVAVDRLSSFLKSEEIQPDAITRLPKAKKNGDVSIEVKDATFLWQRNPVYKVALDNINFKAKKGELTCIVGKVGSGKSALIQSLLGDLERINGSVKCHGNVAYVAQLPWIMNGTVKENILFGHKYDPVFYNKTIKACALTVDFSILTDGDNTLVGEKGISLSGGQKARLSLARAVYARADVYLLDDPLAAVDEHVAKHLIDHVLGPNGLLCTKTKVLATNKISVLNIANSISLLKDGVIVEQGSYDQVMKDGSELSHLINEFGSKRDNNEIVEKEDIDVDELVSSDESIDNTDHLSLRRASEESLGPVKFGDDSKDDERKEHHEKGKVKTDIYVKYAKACNPKHVLVFIFFIILSMMLSVLGNVWLKHWSDINTRLGFNPNIAKYLGIYFLLGFGSALSTLIQTVIVWIYCSIEGSKILHRDMINSVLRSPMEFFETTPIGRIMNRFSNDIYKIDEILPRTFANLFSTSTRVLFTILVICFSTWQFIFMIVPMMFLYYYFQQYYIKTSRELRRLDSITRSPIFAHFQETLGGVSTIRGFNQQDRFKYINQSRIDNNMSAYFPSINCNRWLAVRLEFLGSLIILSASGLCIVTLRYGNISAGLVGLSVSYALQITQALNWIVRMTVEVETNIVSVERVKEYSELKPEGVEIIEPRPPVSWPSKGEIVFKDYSTRYREGLDLVLKKINLSIKPKEKIGIVGRTGAGKSSLTLAIYRIIEKVGDGDIFIDGIPISKIGLSDLRSRLSIIPQDSQVFEGTVRENIDPTNKYTDAEIWNALELSHLKGHIQSMGDEGLETKLNEGGSNLSVGQRQLMCLARALLIPSSILILDEATAAVDVETDKLIQETIRKEFSNRTILTIAHRLNTIMDSDKIVVLDQGEVKEFDSPENLLKREDSLFYSLVNNSK